MAEFRIVTEDELRPVLGTLNSMDWPVPFDMVPELFQQLGWEKQRRKGGKTSFPISFPIVSVGDLQGELSRVEFRVSDTLPGASVENEGVVERAFPEAVRVVSSCLGVEPTDTPWVDPGVQWNLDGGRQINLIQGEKTIELLYWSKRLADIERYERSRGVDPAHDLDDRE
ncbi:DUF6301 family protein [Propionicicella superfundia]|uniref:DUF6301 family protein n=1 Tax=Propionicicella superfundia TaxID=348582 RepID=UPI0012EB817D|nr:DUF6301 family protein [Propionicicella superfundia]